MQNELHSMEVILTYTEGEALFLVKSSPTPDFHPGRDAEEWITLAKTGRCRVVMLAPVPDAASPAIGDGPG